ncbi:FG-GAP-like repeat-containing protein [Micromonospora aurantiaca]|uniref:FG-GAP-like repeat-containing protein n=1 Tax=Micromonospora aurantiaca (nom. illeg.) TaxID=47850 RepID=UPI0011CDC50C|nr:FG-GAP-like repeat-containing protein [Micromonospora aurantiaca]
MFVRLGWLVRRGALPTAVVVGLSLLPFVPVQAAPKPSADGVARDRSVPVSAVKPKKAALPAMEKFKPAAVSWPSAAAAVVDLPLSADGSRRLPARAKVGGLPVAITPAAASAKAAGGAAVPPRVAVRVLDRAAARRAGFPLAVKVARADGRSEAGRVELELDYSGFRHAFGADWDSRLQLVSLPACALTSPEVEACRQAQPLSTVNDYRAGVVRAEVEVTPDLPALSEKEAAAAGLDRPAAVGASEQTVVALSSAGSSSDTGDYSKTDLSASSQWVAGGSSADFSWNYPIAGPPVPGGLEPGVSLGYGSGSVDGRTAGENVQPSWLGEGWDYQPGFIERSYRPCWDDREPGTTYWTAANGLPDACWRLNNARISWQGRTTEIVPGDDGVWRLADDDGSKVELLSDNGTDVTLNWNNERWRITTGDGTQYYFGQSVLPGTTTRTNSVQGQRVVSNDSGEPCFSTASLAASGCAMAYRWNLDYVVDAHGNSMVYYYNKEYNRQRVVGSTSIVTYDRAAQLDRIEYGLRAGSEGTTTAPAKIVFNTADRCLTSSCVTHDKANWPDTPWDLACSASPCGPASFWSTRRLTSIASQTWTGTGTTYSTVDQWDLTHQFPATGNGTSPALWMASITRTGKANGGSIALPAVTFNGVRFDQRADYDPNGTMAKPRKWRIAQIDTETGGRIDVAYEATDPGCQFGTAFPDPDNNTKRCFPQYYYPQQAPEGWSWWHKYIVKSVTEKDLVGGSPDVVTSYSYSTAGSSTPVLWGHDNGAATWASFLPKRSWADWRGYSTVTVTTGPSAGPQTQTKYLYYRGLWLDSTDTGENRASSITNSLSQVSNDDWSRRGFLHEKIEYASPNGQALTKTIFTPVSHQTGQRILTAEWAIPTKHTSYITRTAQESTYTWLTSTNTWRSTRVNNTWNSSTGLLTEVDDVGDTDTAAPADETCTTYTYASNTTPNLRRFDGTGPSALNLLPAVVAADWSGYDVTFPAGDFNADGKTDLVARRPADGSLWLIPGNGSGGYGSAVKIGNSGWNAYQDLFSPGDFTGDGKPDVIGSKPDGTLWRWNNATTLSNPTQIGTTSWQNYDLFSPGDFTGDGKSDVLGRNTNGALYIWPGTGSGTVATGTQIGTSGWNAYTQAFGWGDITGDGKTDIMAADQAGIWLYAGNGTGGYAARARMATGLIGLDTDWFIATGDITGDGKADLLARQQRHLTSPKAGQHTEAVSCPASPTFPADALGDSRYYFDQPGAVTPSLSVLPVIGDITRTEQAEKYIGSTPTWISTGEATYDRWGRPTALTDALGWTATTAYTHASNGLLASVKITNPALHQTITNVDPALGVPRTTTDANGKTTTAAYDALGRLTKVWLPGRALSDSGNQEYIYSTTKTAPSYVQSKILGPNNNQISSFEIYDGHLRLRQEQTTTADGKRAVADTQYDGRGLTAKTSALYNSDSAPTSTLLSFADSSVASQQRTTYDGTERQIVDALWSLGSLKWQTSTSYGGDRVTIDPPDGATPTTTLHDARGNKTALREYKGSSPSGDYDETRYTYDPLAKITSVTDGAGNTWSFNYDLLGRQTSRVDPDAGTTTSTYDKNGQLVSTADSRGEVLVRVYDQIGRLKELHDDTTTGPLRTSYVYDTLAKGQLTSSTRHVGSNAYTTTITGYTDQYAPTGTTVTIPGAEGALAGSYSTSATYNPDGSPATTDQPAVGGLPAEILTHSYNDAGLPITLTGATTYVSSTNYAWDASVTRLLLGDGGKRVRVTDTRDEATRRLASRQVDTENATHPDTFDGRSTNEYGYDQAGNITAIAGKTNGSRDQVECFRYDYLRRLTDAWSEAQWDCNTPQRTGSDPYRLSWTYDSTGNRRTQTSYSSTGSTLATYRYPTPGGPGPHQLTKIDYTGEITRADTYEYDDAGNTTTRTVNNKLQALTWDPEGHLATTTESGQATSYVYDPAGNRLVRHDSSGTTLYLGATELRLTGGGQVDGTRYYQHGGATVAVRTITGLSWLVGDHQGTNQLAIAPDTLQITRRRLMPFGEPRSGQAAGWPGEKGFVGGSQDPTGLTHLGAREYDSAIGRFVSVDPLMDTADPQQWNGYSYANNTPVTSSDPSGLIPDDCKYFDCYSYNPKTGCPHGCGSTDNVDYGKKRGLTSTRAKSSKSKRAPKPAETAKVTFHKNGTIATKVGDKYYVNGVDVTEGLKIEGAPSFDEFAAGFDRFVGDNPPGAGKDIYDPSVVTTAIYLANSEGYIKARGGSVFHMWAAGQADLVGGVMASTALSPPFGGGLPIGGGRKGSRGGMCSFSGETEVLLADGSTKAIRDIRIGDQVLATNPETGEEGRRTVTHLWVHEDQLFDLKVDGGALSTTEDHPFWNETDKQWQQSQELTAGDELRSIGGTTLIVRGLEWGSKRQALAFNLSVEGIHTYYVIVGSAPVLVHNTRCGSFGFPKAPEVAGVYTITMKDGRVYVGSSRVDVHSRIHSAFTSKDHAVYIAGYTKADIANISVNEMPGLSWNVIRGQEQSVIDYYGGIGGGTLLNRRNEVA